VTGACKGAGAGAGGGLAAETETGAAVQQCCNSPVMGVAKPVVLLKARCCISSQSYSVKSSAAGTDEAVGGDEGEECAGEGNAYHARQEATTCR